MKTIYKYILKITDRQLVRMHEGANILTTANQRGELCIWAEVDTSRPCENRNIRIVGTGNPFIPKNPGYIGSAQIEDFVWHVYEE